MTRQARALPTTAPLLLLLSAVLAPGCATRGVAFEEDRVPHLERGVTTQEEVRSWFGQPVSVSLQGSGISVWRYLHEEETRRDTGTITKIGRSIASIFGRGGYVPPVDVAYGESVRHDLEVLFYPDGVVADYRYQRTEIPTKQIY